MHVSDDAAPRVVEYVPDRQEAHTSELVAARRYEYVPAMQDVHVPASLSDHEPARQSRHVCEPTVAQVPATHELHTLLLAPTTALNWPARQSMHDSDADAPTVVEYEPALQLRQADCTLAAIADE